MENELTIDKDLLDETVVKLTFCKIHFEKIHEREKADSIRELIRKLEGIKHGK